MVFINLKNIKNIMVVSNAWQRLYINGQICPLIIYRVWEKIMTHRVKMVAALMTLTTGLCLAPLASAQEAYRNNFSSNNNSVSTTAGMHLTIPFGGKNSDRVVDRARVGLMLNMTREYNDRNFYTPIRVKTNLLDFGMQLDGRPTMLMGGEDIYTPLFTPLSANEYGVVGTGVSKNTILVIAGGALAVGAAVALASGGDDNDGPDNDRDDDDDD